MVAQADEVVDDDEGFTKLTSEAGFENYECTGTGMLHHALLCDAGLFVQTANE
jgi:hypothetical protein